MNVVVDTRAKQSLWEVISGERSPPSYILHDKPAPLVTIGEGNSQISIASSLQKELTCYIASAAIMKY